MGAANLIKDGIPKSTVKSSQNVLTRISGKVRTNIGLEGLATSSIMDGVPDRLVVRYSLTRRLIFMGILAHDQATCLFLSNDPNHSLLRGLGHCDLRTLKIWTLIPGSLTGVHGCLDLLDHFCRVSGGHMERRDSLLRKSQSSLSDCNTVAHKSLIPSLPHYRHQQ